MIHPPGFHQKMLYLLGVALYLYTLYSSLQQAYKFHSVMGKANIIW